MQDILDSIRKIISKWVQTITPLTSDVVVGDNIVEVKTSIRFQVGDQVMIKDDTVAETGLVVEEIIDRTHIKLTTSVLNNWTTSQNSVLIKTINDMFIQGIYIGDPDVISHYPAITVNGTNRDSEWMTLDSTKERYDIEINTMVLDSTHEDGYRFMLEMTKTIERGLKKNIFPLIGDFSLVSLIANAVSGDLFLKVNNTSPFISQGKLIQGRLILEDEYQSEELWVDEIIDSQTIKLVNGVCFDYDKDDTTLILPTRFIYNSWPANTDYGKLHKGTLLKASSIKWFAEEEELQLMRKQDPKTT